MQLFSWYFAREEILGHRYQPTLSWLPSCTAANMLGMPFFRGTTTYGANIKE